MIICTLSAHLYIRTSWLGKPKTAYDGTDPIAKTIFEKALTFKNKNFFFCFCWDPLNFDYLVRKQELCQKRPL
jgi:hypothetical protein